MIKQVGHIALGFLLGAAVGFPVAWIQESRSSDSAVSSVEADPGGRSRSATNESERKVRILRAGPSEKRWERWLELSQDDRQLLLQPMVADLTARELLESARKMSSTSPESVLALRKILPEGEQKDSLLSRALGASWKADSEGTLRWLESIDPEECFQLVQKSRFFMRDFSREEVLRLAGVMPATASRDRMLGELLPMLKIEEAYEVLDRIDSEEIQDAALGDLASQLQMRDPAIAFEVGLQINDQDRRNRLFRDLAWNAREYDLPLAFRSVYEIDDDRKRRSSLRNLMSFWTENDTEGAGQWLNGLESGTDRDSAILGFTDELLESGSAAPAGPWVTEISAPRLRMQSAVKVGREWLREDRAAGERWLREESDLPVQLIDELLQP